MRVCLDPGHGEHDPGAIGPSGLKEKDVALSVTLKVGQKLKDNGLDVIYTRIDDNPGFPKDERQNLAKRASIANMAKVDCFVSIHCNSVTDRTANGTETYCVKFGYQAEKLSRQIQNELINSVGLNNRGVKVAGFYVIKYTLMPAALVEIAFISNPAEEKLLAKEDFQENVASAIAKGICQYAGIEYLEIPLDLSSWAKESWPWGMKNNITDGKKPKATATREEVVTMIYRAVKGGEKN